MGVLMPITNNLICATTIPTAVICCLIAGIVVALVFIAAFFLELVIPSKNGGRSSRSETTEDFDIDEMLSKLEQSSAKAEQERKEEERLQQTKILAPIEEIKTIQPAPVVEPTPAPVVKPVVEEKPEEVIPEDYDFDALFAKIENELKESRDREVEVQAKEEILEETPVVEPIVIPAVEDDVVPEIDKIFEEKFVESEVQTTEPKVVGPDFDYNVRLETINSSLAKLEKDLAKATKEVNKFEKTEKRKERNEKLLDRKATELTNLNLVLYNVNDIKDIDPEKKAKQESLVEHISELKNTISEATEYIAKNREKYDNSKKIKTFLEGEKARYNEEIAELNMLIAQAKKNK